MLDTLIRRITEKPEEMLPNLACLLDVFQCYDEIDVPLDLLLSDRMEKVNVSEEQAR